MSWYFGYSFKWKHVRRLAEEQGLLDEKNVSATDNRVQSYLRRTSRVNFRIVYTHKDIVICFHKSAVRGDLSGLKIDMAKIKFVGRIFYGKDRNPRWFAAYSDLGLEDDSSEDEGIPPIAPPGYFDPVTVLPPDLAKLFEACEDGRITEDQLFGDAELTTEEYKRIIESPGEPPIVKVEVAAGCLL